MTADPSLAGKAWTNRGDQRQSGKSGSGLSGKAALAINKEGQEKSSLPKGILPRPDPGYLQWLEKQSLLGASAGHAAQVSGSGRLWQNSSQQKLAPMQDAAPNWLLVNPHAISGRAVARQLLALDLPSILSGCGLNGLYLAPAGELGQIWTSDGSDSHLAASGPERQPWQYQPDTAAVTSLFPDSHLGNDKDLATLGQALDRAQLQAGGDLLPAATGIGPDFMLQARHASRFDGIYAMLPVPREHWDKLPDSGEATNTATWKGMALTESQVAALAAHGILPGKLLRDRLGHASRGGWAATGLVQGADGQPRRLVYRFSRHPGRPVLLWQDPSGRARQIFSAAIIRHTGLQGQSLAGLRLEAIMGLDSAPHDLAPEEAASEGRAGQVGSGTRTGADVADGDLAPGLEAIDNNAREIHRYGGWALQADSLPPSVTQRILGTAVDFSVDTWTQPAVNEALLSGRVDQLQKLLQSSLPQTGKSGQSSPGIADHSRLARMPAPAGAAGGQSLVSLARQALAGGKDAAEDQEALARTCLLLLALRLGQPGLAFVDLGELVGQIDGRSQFSISGSGQNQAFGLPQAGKKDGRTGQNIFSASLGRLFEARQKYGLARGNALSAQSGTGWLAHISRLPDGSCWLVACNFSGQKQNAKIRLPEAGAFSAVRDLGSGKALAARAGGQYLEIELARLSARHILLEAGKRRR